MNLLLFLAVVAAGAAMAFQQVLNANLRVELGSPWWAGLASYVVGTMTMVTALLISGAALPSATAIRSATPISWAGGLFGAIFIATVILTVPRLGAATVLALIVVGQMFGSLLFDHFGVLGLPVQPITPARIAGALMLIGGVFLIQK